MAGPVSERSRCRLFLDARMDRAESHVVAGGCAVVFCTPSPLRKSENQDAAAVIPAGDAAVVLAVADGVGGVPGGARAARTVIESLCRSVDEAARNGEASLRGAILDGIEAASRELVAEENGAATTMVAAEVGEGGIRTFHVGDSVALLVGQRGRVKFQTVSHSPVGYAVEAGLLDETKAMEHRDRHLISNAVGNTEMRIEMGPRVAMAPRDTLLLASDGLFDNLRPGEIVEGIRKGSPDGVARRIAHECEVRMRSPMGPHPSKPDDLSFILFRRSPCRRSRSRRRRG